MSGRFHRVARCAVVALTVLAVACSTKEDPAGASRSASKGARPPPTFVLQAEPPAVLNGGEQSGLEDAQAHFRMTRSVIAASRIRLSIWQ